jgi:hypothetical protein
MFETWKPDFWVFAHHHVNVTREISGTRFICLDELDFIDLEIQMGIKNCHICLCNTCALARNGCEPDCDMVYACAVEACPEYIKEENETSN